jgi:hypothetical protein
MDDGSGGHLTWAQLGSGRRGGGACAVVQSQVGAKNNQTKSCEAPNWLHGSQEIVVSHTLCEGSFFGCTECGEW